MSPAPKKTSDGGARILAGLNDAIAYARGDTSRARVYAVKNGQVVDVTPPPKPRGATMAYQQGFFSGGD